MAQDGVVRSDLQTGERKSIVPAHPEATKLRFNWNPGMAIDPHDGALYFGSQFVHRSTDMGTTWTLISPDLTTNDLPWCIALDNSKGISRLRFWCKNSRVNGINDLPVFMHQGSVCVHADILINGDGVRRHTWAN